MRSPKPMAPVTPLMIIAPNFNWPGKIPIKNSLFSRHFAEN